MAEQITENSARRQLIVAAYPPLGLITKLTTTVVEFSCTLKDDTGSGAASWHVRLHYVSIGSDEWKEDDLKCSQASLFQPQSQEYARETLLVFEATFKIMTATRFRLSFRHGQEEPWFMVGEDSAPESIVIPALENHFKRSLDINDYMQDLNQELQPKLLDDGSESGVVSWIVETPVDAASGENPYMTQVMLGKPFDGKFLRWFAISRNTTSWMAPRQGREYFKLDVAAIICSFINHQGENLIALGLSGFENIMTIFGDNNEGAMMIKIRNESEAPGHGRVIIAVGADLEATLASTLNQAREIFVSAAKPLDKNYLKQSTVDWADQWMNGLIYNPANEQRQKWTEEEIINSLDTLFAKGITVSGLILEDIWQKVDLDRPSKYHAGLIDFEADPGTFKSGLKRAVAEIKNRHRSIRNVIVEHPIFGHWGGISDYNGPERALQKIYRTTYVQRSEMIQPNQKAVIKLSLVLPQDAQKFFEDYYKFLSSCDISAVRATGLYMLETLASARDRCSLAEVYLDAQSTAALQCFPDASLTSMSLSPSALLNNLKPFRRQVVRNIGIFSDHRKYVFNNAINALFSKGIGNIPDWGPIENTKDEGIFHAAARTISGGPIQISSFDNSEIVNLEIFQRVSASTAKGKTVALRPNGIGRTTNPYVDFRDNVLLKIANTHNIETGFVSILGVFNVSDQPIFELLQLQDFPDLDTRRGYIVRSTSGKTSGHLRLDSSLLISIDLDISSHDFLCAYPLTTLTSTQGDNNINVTVLGLKQKMLGVTAIINSSYSIEDDAISLKAVLKGVGYLEFYISDISRREINERTCKLKVQGKSFAPSTETVSVTDEVMTLDLESIWKEQNLESHTDEIYVEVTLYPF